MKHFKSIFTRFYRKAFSLNPTARAIACRTNMRFLTVMSFVLAMIPGLSAASRSREEAKNLAERKLSRTLLDVEPALGLGHATRSEEIDNYFIFETEGGHGYVIVSADDCFEDILGYTDTGSYSKDNVNPAFAGWLNAISEEMDFYSRVPSYSGTKKERVVDTPEIAPLLKTTWGQNAPYNNHCWETGSLRPTIGWTPGHAPTGCVATAMAQVMNYHQWPPSYTDGNTTYDYKWDLMQSSYGGSESEEAIDQVASLMSHCGKSVNTYYEATQSGASTFDVPGAMVNKFGYDGQSIRKVWRDSYGYDAIHSILYNELQEGRPILAGGEYPGIQGHQFVIDGCSSDGLFHVNWGWDGNCDGYFRLTAMRPSEFGTGGSQEGFSFCMDFTVGIRPALSEATDMDAQLIAFGDLAVSWDSEEEYLETSYGSFKEITVTTVNGRYSGFMNTGTSDFNGGYGETRGKLYTCLTDLITGEETIVDYYDYIVRGLKPGQYTDSFTIYPRHLKDKTPYKVTLLYTNNSTDYKEVQFNPGCRSHLILERDGEVLKITQPRMESALKADLPSDFLRLMRRNSQSIRVSFSNPGDTEYLGLVKCRFTDVNGNPYDALTDYAMVNLPEGASTTEEFMLYNLAAAPAGEYMVALYDFRNRLISAPKRVELYDYCLDLDAVNFPDDIFRKYLADNFDGNQDGSLSDQEIAAVHVITLDGLTVRDFTGIDNFHNLYGLNVKGSDMTIFRLPTATRISQLDIQDTPLESISLTELPKLEYLCLNRTNIKELDLTGFPALYGVDVDENKLEKLILPTSDKLETLYCSDNSLEELDVSGVKNLFLLYFSSNRIKTIEISQLKDLQYFSAYGNQLESLDLRGLEKLSRLRASSNAISEFYIGSHPKLTYLDVDDNPLDCPIDLTGCPALTGIYLSHTGITELRLPELVDLTHCYIYGNAISGLVDFSKSQKLQVVSCEDNGDIELNFGKHPLLENLWIEGSKITGNVLDLTASPELSKVDAADCGLKTILLGESPKLTYLRILRNEIEGTLDITGLSGLTDLYAAHNKISELRHTRNPNLDRVSLDYNELTHFHADDFPAMKSYSVGNQSSSHTISTVNFNTKNIAGFEQERAFDWIAEWETGGEQRSAECSVISGVIRIPEEAGRDVRLRYSYLTDAVNDKTDVFVMNLTRDCFNGVDEIMAEGTISVNGREVTFADGVYGEIFTSSGMRIYNGIGETVSLESGIYVVRIGVSSLKISIR